MPTGMNDDIRDYTKKFFKLCKQLNKPWKSPREQTEKQKAAKGKGGADKEKDKGCADKGKGKGKGKRKGKGDGDEEATNISKAAKRWLNNMYGAVLPKGKDIETFLLVVDRLGIDGAKEYMMADEHKVAQKGDKGEGRGAVAPLAPKPQKLTKEGKMARSEKRKAKHEKLLQLRKEHVRNMTGEAAKEALAYYIDLKIDEDDADMPQVVKNIVDISVNSDDETGSPEGSPPPANNKRGLSFWNGTLRNVSARTA